MHAATTLLMMLTTKIKRLRYGLAILYSLPAGAEVVSAVHVDNDK